MIRQVLGAVSAAVVAVAFFGTSGGTPAYATALPSEELPAPGYGQDAVCAERCHAIGEACDVKCLSEAPKNAKDAETTTECAKKCEIDPKKLDPKQWSAKEKGCVNACVNKVKPCIKGCHAQMGACLRKCDT